jgi:hypothetical protein
MYTRVYVRVCMCLHARVRRISYDQRTPDMCFGRCDTRCDPLAVDLQGSSSEGNGRPCVCIWDTTASPPSQVVRLDLPTSAGPAATR